MTKFTELPPLGSTVLLAGRTIHLPTAEYLQSEVRVEAQPFYIWYRLCPILHDVIVVDTRPKERFLVIDEGVSTMSHDRWICHVRQIDSLKDNVLKLGSFFQWTIVLPGAKRSSTYDECTISQCEIVGQAHQVYRMK